MFIFVVLYVRTEIKYVKILVFFLKDIICLRFVHSEQYDLHCDSIHSPSTIELEYGLRPGFKSSCLQLLIRLNLI